MGKHHPIKPQLTEKLGLGSNIKTFRPYLMSIKDKTIEFIFGLGGIANPQFFMLLSTGAAGFEPATRDLEGRYSIQLSYAPNYSNY